MDNCRIPIASAIGSLSRSISVMSNKVAAALGNPKIIIPDTIRNIPGNKHKDLARLIFLVVAIINDIR